jgi:hypothetical protein
MLLLLLLLLLQVENLGAALGVEQRSDRHRPR